MSLAQFRGTVPLVLVAILVVGGILTLPMLAADPAITKKEPSPGHTSASRAAWPPLSRRTRPA